MIDAQNLSFSYDFSSTLIEDMSFQVAAGEIFGFLGPSGAGKSTLQKILCGILRNYRGQVTVMDREVKKTSEDFYTQIGVDFEFPNLYSKFTGLENLTYFASLYGRNDLDPYPHLERIGLSGDMHKKVSSYSKGMKMRLAFVRAILHQPRLLFLDEPTSGLDPAYARILKDMILEQKEAGRTVILTTHNMHDAEELCDRVAFIVDGEIRALDTPAALRSRETGVKVRFTYENSEQILSGHAPLESLKSHPDFMHHLQNGTLRSIHSREPTLEDVFIELTGRHLS